jgi:outer membrane protein OmpA-like peptidoglycan-associated protein
MRTQTYLFCLFFALYACPAFAQNLPLEWKGIELVREADRNEDWISTLSFEHIPNVGASGTAILYQYEAPQKRSWVRFEMTVFRKEETVFVLKHTKVLDARPTEGVRWCMGEFTLKWDKPKNVLNGKSYYSNVLYAGCADADLEFNINTEKQNIAKNDPKPAQNQPNKLIANAQTAQKNKTTIPLHKVLFELKTDVLLAEAYPELDQLAQELKDSPKIEIRIEGHTDKGYSEKADNKLSQERAERVKKYLTEKGIAAKRIQTKGFGHSRLLKPAPNPENRRVEFVVIKF